MSTAIGRDFEAATRRRLKKDLLDALDTKYAFELPPSLVAQEFAAVWAQVEEDLKTRGKTFEDEDTTEEKAQAEYRKIAERRVRLGLVLAQVGESADIKISDEEVNQALIARVRQFPGQEQQVWDFYRRMRRRSRNSARPCSRRRWLTTSSGRSNSSRSPSRKRRFSQTKMTTTRPARSRLTRPILRPTESRPVRGRRARIR